MTLDTEVGFDVEAYLQRQSVLVSEALDRYLNRYPGAQQTLFRAMHHGVFPGGKRIRPILTLAAGEMLGAAAGALLPFAGAIELVHSYSLIHDDLPALDNDEFRRGQPATHRVFGAGMALLAGDGLLTEAFHWISDPELTRGLHPKLVLELIHELTRAAGVMGLVGGQALDLEAEGSEADLARVEVIHVRKTGALILAAVRIGGRVGGASDGELAQLTRYGEYLGLAFQIADDILDAREPALPRNESERKEHKKATYPAVVGVVQARERLNELVDSALGALAPFGERAVPLASIARHIGSRARASHP
jgi:geranylgeranyl diphosphate synthase type II